MTTKPKAKKFRIRRTGSLGRGDPAQDSGAQGDSASPNMNAGAAQQQVMQGEVSSAAEVSGEEALAEIRKEGLTGRQLRMARRVAQRHNIAATSDYDAVRMLRARGIDPFQRSNMLELVVAETNQQQAQNNLPQTVQQGQQQLPSTAVLDEDTRAREIRKIQQDIVRRRRRKLALLMTRLAFFVLLPTLIAGYYYYKIATPLYATKSEFVIQQSESASATGLGSILGPQFATSQDSITVQSYLQSRDAMLRLDEELGFKEHFSQPDLDPMLRLPPESTNEAAYRIYSKYVVISFDPTEGIIKMEVAATDPAVSAAFAEALLGYAESIVDNLSQRLREDQMRGARESFEDAEGKRGQAQRRVIELQQDYEVISSDVEISLLTNQIATLETELTQDRLQLIELMSNTRPNPARVDPLKRRIESLENAIAEMRSLLTEGAKDGTSLAEVQSQLAVAQADLETRNLMMQQSLQQLESARIEANRQTRYLSTGVSPTPPDEATYPRKFENTLLAFLIFSGIYLMVSITASILREQVTS